MTTITDWLQSEEPEKPKGEIGTWLNRDVTRLRVSQGQDTSPETAARILNAGIKTGLPREFITRNLDKVETAVKRRDFSPERFKRESPVFASWAAENPNHWAVVADDYENLSALEWVTKAFGAARQEGWATIHLNRLYSQLAKEGQAPEDNEEIGRKIAELETQVGGHNFGADDWWSEAVVETARQLPQMTAAVKSGLTLGTSTAMGAATITAIAGQAGPQIATPEELVTVPAAFGIGFTGGFASGAYLHSDEQITGAAYREYLQFRDQGDQPLDPKVARIAAEMTGVLGGLLEATGLGLIAKNVPGTGAITDRFAKTAVKKALESPTFLKALTSFAGGAAQSIGGEVATEVGQEAVTILAGEIAKQVSPGDFPNLTPEQITGRLAEIAKVTLQSSLVIGGAGPTIQLGLDANRARSARNQQDLFKALGETATNSKLRERVPAKFREFVDKLRKEGGVSEVNIPVERFDEYFQGLDLDPEQVAAEITGSPDAYREAKAAGTDLAIPIADYAEKIAGGEHHNGLLKDLRLRPDDMTMREAETWSKDHEKILADLAEGVPESGIGQAPEVYQDVLGQLLAAGHEQFAAEQQATLFESVFATLGQRTGIDPAALYRQYGLRIPRPLPDILTNVTDFDTEVDPLIDRLRAGDIPTDRQVFGESLSDFLKARGGLQDDSELGARDAGKAIRGLIKKRGDTLGGAAEAAAEAGFITEATPDALLEALDRELAGEYVPSGRQTDEPLQQLRGALDSLSEYLDSIQVDITRMDNAAIKALILEPASFEQEKRGSITFNEQTRQATIRLFKAADLSTVLHESGHLYLEILGDLAEADGVPEQIVSDYSALLNWFGVENRQGIGRDHHEQFARGFEAYLREGKAPSIELQNAFATFRAWLVNIYRKVRQLNVNLTDDVRGVFDRLVATDDAIAAAEATQNYIALFTTPETAGKSPEEFSVYRAQVEAARLEAETSLTAKLLAIETRESKKWWKDERAKMREAVADEVHRMRVYRALSLIRMGQNPDGSESRLKQVKLDRDQLLGLYGQAFIKRLPGRGKSSVYAAEGGIDVDTVAGLFGYGSGDEMIQEMVNARPMKELIEAEADARMGEAHPDPMTDGSLANSAMNAVHNEKRGELLAAEMKALRRLTRRDRPIVSATLRAQARQQREARQASLPDADERRVIKAAAYRIIAGKKVRDLNPATFRTAEARASREAFQAAAKGDYETAYQAKRRQLLNLELFRAAEKAKAESESIRKYLKKFERKRVRQRLGKAGEGLLEQIDLVMSDIDLRRQSGAAVDRNKARVELMKMIDEGAIIASPEVVQRLQADKRENWIELSVEQFRGIRDIVKQLDTRASSLSVMVINGEKMEIAKVAGEIASAVTAANKVVYPGIGQPTGSEGVKRSAKQARESWLRPASIARILDGAEFGPMTRHVIALMRRAYTEKLIPAERKAREDMAEIYNRFYSKAELGKFSQRKKVDALEATLSKSDILSIALNWGAEGNRDALLSGRRLDGMSAYTKAGVIEAMQTHLDARDWKFVEAVWDYLDSYWPQIKETEQRRRGIAPKKVPASSFTIQTKDGQTLNVKGGYYPLKYDSRHGYRTKELEIEDHYKRMGNGFAVTASTRAGATHERVGSGGQVVRLGLGNIDRHLNEIVRDMAIGDEVNFIKRVFESAELRNAMAKTGNVEAREALNLWLQDSAVGEMPAYGAIEQGLAYVRTGFTKAKLAWNALTTVLQLTGIAQTTAVVGSQAMAHGVGRFVRSPREAHKHIMATSKFMQLRYEANTWNKDVADTQAHLGAIFGGGLPTRAAVVTKGIASTYFWPIAKMQMIVDEVTWLAGYWNGVDKEGLSDSDAVLFADSQVEKAQTSGIFSDRSGIERGTSGMRNTRQSQFIRIWTTLISYMLAKGNIAYEKGHAFAKQPTLKGAVHLATDILLLYTVEAMMSAVIYGKWPDEDDDEPWLTWAAKETGLSALSGVPFVREVYGARFSSGTTPVGALTTDLYQLYTQAAQGEIDKTLIKEMNNVGGTLLHYPSSQTNRLIDSLWRENVEGEDVEMYEFLTGERDYE